MDRGQIGVRGGIKYSLRSKDLGRGHGLEKSMRYKQELLCTLTGDVRQTWGVLRMWRQNASTIDVPSDGYPLDMSVFPRIVAHELRLLVPSDYLLKGSISPIDRVYKYRACHSLTLSNTLPHISRSTQRGLLCMVIIHSVLRR